MNKNVQESGAIMEVQYATVVVVAAAAAAPAGSVHLCHPPSTTSANKLASVAPSIFGNSQDSYK
jgi:hypothetical protein